MNKETVNSAFKKRMAYEGVLTAHGMRSIASTALNEHGFDEELVEYSLAHVDKNSVRATYNNAEYIERRRALLKWWSDFISEATTGTTSLADGIKRLELVSV